MGYKLVALKSVGTDLLPGVTLEKAIQGSAVFPSLALVLQILRLKLFKKCDVRH